MHESFRLFAMDRESEAECCRQTKHDRQHTWLLTSGSMRGRDRLAELCSFIAGEP